MTDDTRAAPTPEATTARCRICGATEREHEPGLSSVTACVAFRPEATGAPEPDEDTDASIALTVRGLRSLTESFDRAVNATRGGVMLSREMAYAIQVELRDKLNSRATVAALTAEREAAQRVHLARHTRLAEALGIDPGYSADATIDAAIKAIVESRALTAERGARETHQQNQNHLAETEKNQPLAPPTRGKA